MASKESSFEQQTDEVVDRVDGAELCPHCLNETDPALSLCPKCGAPVNGTAGIAPLERVLAEGFIYRNAVAEPRRPLIVAGIWMIFGPTFLGSAAMLISGWTGDWAQRLIAAIGLVLSASILWQVTANYRRRRNSSGSVVD